MVKGIFRYDLQIRKNPHTKNLGFTTYFLLFENRFRLFFCLKKIIQKYYMSAFRVYERDLADIFFHASGNKTTGPNVFNGVGRYEKILTVIFY